MAEYFDKVKSMLLELELPVVSEDAAQEVVVVEDEDAGIKNLVLDCEAPILIAEQPIMPVPAKDREKLFTRLLQMNRSLVHGAFVLDADCKTVLFRDTLELENLDKNELEATVHALTLALIEFGGELLDFHKKQ